MNPSNCVKWNSNRNINPITNRKIKEHGTIYKKFLKECKDTKISIYDNIKKFCDVNKELKAFIESKDEEYYNKLKEFCKKILKNYDWGKEPKEQLIKKPIKEPKEPKEPLIKEAKKQIKFDEENMRMNNKKILLDYFDKNKLNDYECIKLTQKDNQYLLTDNILLYKQIGSISIYGAIYKSKNINTTYKAIPEFVSKIQLNTDVFNNEYRILKLILKLQKQFLLFPMIYKIIRCNNLIRDNKYPPILAKAPKQYKKYSIVLYELCEGDLNTFLISNNNLDEKIWKNIYEQIFMSIFAYHSIFLEFHNDTHFKNFLYRKIQPGGCFCYIINGEKYYIENLGYILMLWDYGNSQPLHKLSDSTWLNDYNIINLCMQKSNDNQKGYLPKEINIPESILKLQKDLANHIYYKSYKTNTLPLKYFEGTNKKYAMTEYQWFKLLLSNNILFSKTPIGKVIYTSNFENPNKFYYSDNK